ncbi:phosphatidylglycerol lysyltransferase domain-containing protein [Treponema sp. OttesenSCG-928-L16]|nr:phosphatidylglycerol lysyltransferase domain-containing protein [Treponema sp. OttesenSCG-928-L16]
MSFELKSEMHPQLSMTPDGVSEYTFSNLYLFRKRYNYKISRILHKTFIISGEREGKKFFMTPCDVPPRGILSELFETHDYWKGISDSVLAPHRVHLEQWGIEVSEDRDNFDYLYLRTDLAELSGKKYHKKRNLVNAFINSYKYQERPLTRDLIPQAVDVLDRWRQDKGTDGDYIAAREALELFDSLNMRGAMYYVDGTPAGWCLGESLAKGRMFAIHFEKGIDEYKGIYQFINQAFAAALPRYYIHINREQDLGDEGLRQAKMTYRPSGFVRKYLGKRL